MHSGLLLLRQMKLFWVGRLEFGAYGEQNPKIKPPADSMNKWPQDELRLGMEKTTRIGYCVPEFVLDYRASFPEKA